MKRNVLSMIKEALFGEHSRSQVHSYDKLIINTHPRIHLRDSVITKILYILILKFNYNVKYNKTLETLPLCFYDGIQPSLVKIIAHSFS